MPLRVFARFHAEFSYTNTFVSYAGISTNKGFALIEEEIVGYTIGSGLLNITRGEFTTKATPHDQGARIQSYQANGMPLVGINTIHTLPSDSTLVDAMNIDNYFLEVDVAAVAPLRTNILLFCFCEV